jgi:threonine/homoserine/homoserine lactone efflux protein
LLPQFIDPVASVAGQMAALAVTSVVIEFCRIAGSLLVTAGVGMAAIRRT